jgi:hypothetical protein
VCIDTPGDFITAIVGADIAVITVDGVRIAFPIGALFGGTDPFIVAGSGIVGV